VTVLRDIALVTGIVWWLLVAVGAVWIVWAYSRGGEAPIDPSWADHDPSKNGG